MVLTKGKLGAFGSQATRLGSGTLLLLLLVPGLGLKPGRDLNESSWSMLCTRRVQI